MTTSKRIGRKTHVKAMESAAKRRLMVLEHRERARQIATEVREGVAETVTLGEGRGEAFAVPKVEREGVTRPTRRVPGLVWLSTRKIPRITADQKRIGERWGALWRIATFEASLRSCMDDTVTTAAPQTILSLKNAAETRIQASEKLAEMNLILLNQASLLHAMEQVCGRELTPREASRDGRDASRIECLVCVALDMLVEGVGRRVYSGA